MFLTNFSFDAHFPDCSLKIFKKKTKKLETSLEACFFLVTRYLCLHIFYVRVLLTRASIPMQLHPLPPTST